MRPRGLALALAALLGAAVAALPSIASGTSPPGTASFTAVDFEWDANGGGNSATIAPGGTVTFSYPSGANAHNADFASGLQPTSCTQSTGASSGAVPPLPNQPTGPGWSGTCTFNTPGTYTFYCDAHAFMTGTITVQASGSTTTATTTGTTGTTTGTTTTTTGTTTTSTTPTSVPPPTEPTVPIRPPTTTPPAAAFNVPRSQHGSAVHGSVQITRAGAGGRLEVDLLSGHRRFGRLVKTRLRAGTVRFSVPVDATARRTLRRDHRLTLTVRVIVRSRTAAATAVRRVTLSPA